MDKIVEKIPAWALPMLVNADPSGLTDEDIEQVENWCDRNNVQLVCPINDSIEEEMQPYFTSAPAFGGKACDVIDCIVVYNE
jgi:hypothetical protein